MQYLAVLIAPLLSLAYAQTAIPADQLGSPACEADYNTVTQTFTECGMFDKNSIIHFANGTTSVVMCLCKPENLNTLTGIRSSCRSIPAVEEIRRFVAIVDMDCAAFASGSPLPTRPQATGTAVSGPDGRVLSKECIAGRNTALTISSNCGIPPTVTLAASLRQSVVNCMCDNYSVVESSVKSCEAYMGAMELSASREFLSGLKQRCPTTGAQTGAPTSAEMGTHTGTAQVNVKSGAVGSVDVVGFASVAMLVAFALVN
ncbi:hypothetical protein HDU77_006401 [Chytriomyces hyalinus]|nr:hypothetical protein HDU77_006401 [Chytriomyces hyalinus]